MGRLRDAWTALRGPTTTTKGMPADFAGGFTQLMGATRLAPKRGTRELLTSYKDTPHVHSVTRLISSGVAQTAWTLDAVKSKRTGKYICSPVAKVTDARVRRDMLDELRESGQLVPVEEHPLLDLLSAPNPDQSAYAGWQVTALFMLLKGEALWIMERNAQGMPITWRPVPPHWVMKIATAADPFYRISAPGWGGDIPVTEALWFRRLDPVNPYGRGVGTGEALSDEIDTDEFAAKRTRAFFQNGALPDIILSVPGPAGQPTPADQLKDIQERWDQAHRGFWNAYKAWWAGSKIEATRLDTSFKDMQLVALRTFERDVFGQTFGVPPELRGIIDHSNRSTIDAADYICEKHVIMPEREFFRSELQMRLVPQFDERLILGYSNKLPEDAEFQKSMMVAVPAVFKIDELRAMAGAEPLPDGAGEELYRPLARNPDATLAPPEDDAPDPMLDDVGDGKGDAKKPAADDKKKHADPPWARALDAGRRKDTVTGIVGAFEELRPDRLTKELDPVWEERVKQWGEAALDELGVDVSFDMQNPKVKGVLSRAAKKVTGINDTTRQALRDTLLEGVSAGEGIDELKKRVEAAFSEAEGYRAEMIARTEVLGSANQANLAAWSQSGVVTDKRWVHNPSSEPRPTHEELDGVTVGLEEDFETSDGARAPCPGSFGDPAEDINCCCGQRPVVADVKHLSPEERSAFFKAFEDRAAPWEKATAAAVRRGFKAQCADVLAAVEKLRK